MSLLDYFNSLFSQQLPGDDGTLYLVRSFVDLGYFGITVQSLDLIAFNIAAAAENLNRLGGLFDCHIRSIAFSHRARLRCRLVVVEHQCRAVHQPAGRSYFHGHLGQHPLDPLKIPNRTVKLLSRASIVEGSLEPSLGYADR